MLRQVFSFVSRVGEFKNVPETQQPPQQEQQPQPPQQGELQLRPVEATTAGNINDLVSVLCSGGNVDMLFRYQPASSVPAKAEEKIGKLGHLVVSCAASLPLQTPCYAALTLAVNEQIRGSQWEGFASRCVGFASHKFSVDLDTILGAGKNVAQAACRMKLLLRYLAILGKMGVVRGFDEGSDHGSDSNQLTVFGLLSMLVQAAGVSKERNLPATVGQLLVSLVLSTLPYVIEYVPQEAIDELITNPIDSLLQSYKSTFSPGTGCTSILLKGEQDDGEDMGDDEEEDDDDDDDEDNSGQVCDSLQDLLRVSKKLRDPSRFALPLDAPWKGLTRRVAPAEGTGETELQTFPVTFSEEAIYLSVTECNSLRFLLAGVGDFRILPFTLDGLVFGRLPIFGSPPDPDDDDDEEEEEEDEMEDGAAAKNEELEAFKNDFGLLDRFFVADTIRDCLISHETFVNPTGLQFGSPKSAAEELFSVCHVFSGDKPSRGMAYAIVETLLGLVVQSRERSALRHIGLSRILLELTRLRPLLISPALAIAMTNLFEDYLPALVPAARENISRWFAFHLTNTEYQWPSAYWQLWEPYATAKKPTSRGCFVRRIVQVMVENLSDPSVVANECLSNTRSLVDECFPRTTTTALEYSEGDTLGQFEKELKRRVWDEDENPDALLEYLMSEGVTNSLAAVEGRWLKTIALVRVIVSPVKMIQKSLTGLVVKKEEDEGMDQMVDDTHESKDHFMGVSDAIDKYSRCMLGVFTKEAELYGDITEGGALALRQIETFGYFNTPLLQGLIGGFLKKSVVDSTVVARWALGDLGDSTVADVVPRWWEFASDALQQSANMIEGNNGIVVDGNAAEAEALAAREKMLTYTVKRVCSLLAKKNEKRLDPMQVDLLEGMKSVAFKAKSLGTSDSSISALADLCSGCGGSMAVELLKSSLMQL